MSIEDRATVNPNPLVEKDIQRYLTTNGRATDHPAGDGLILLYTTGRKTGEIRRLALGSYPDDAGTRLVIVGNGGDARLPAWYLNLLADPRVWVRKQEDLYEAQASVLGPREREAALRDLAARVPRLAPYQAMAGRMTPVVRLTRTDR